MPIGAEPHSYRTSIRLPSVIAHRGGDWPGLQANSLAAFRHAADTGVGAIEFDVRETSDGVLVVRHDQWIGLRRISDMTYDELKAATDRHGAIEGIATLREVADLARSTQLQLDMHLKERGYEARAIDEVLAKVPASQLVITSFHPESVAASKLARPDVQAGLLTWTTSLPSWLQRFGVADAVGVAQRVGADFVAPYYRHMEPWFVNDARTAGLPLVPWTIGDASTGAALLSNPEVAGIITDHPDS